MDFSSQQTYATDPARVYQMMTDPVFLNEVCRRAGAVTQEVSVSDDTTTMNIQVTAPSSVQKFVGSTLNINQVIRWSAPNADQTRTGTLSLDVPGMPVDVQGKATMTTADAATVLDYAASFVVKIPLLGKKIEQQAMPYVRRAIDVQQEVGNDYLAGKL